MNYFKISWDRITNNGVDEVAQGREVIKIRLLNQLLFITLITSMLAMATYIATAESITIIFTTLVNLITEGTGIYFAYRKKHQFVRFLACVFFPTVIAVHVVILGGNFGEANIFTGIAFTSIILFEDKRRIQVPLVIYICALFIISKLYVINYSTPSMIEKNPYDEIITFPMVILVLGLIVMLYQKSMKRFEEEQEFLINNLEQKNKELQIVNDELEQFTYIASHDLKTPLRTIISHIGLSKRHLSKSDYEATKADLDFINQSAQQMYTLISGILEYKSLDKKEERHEVLDVKEVIDKVLLGLESLVVEKNAVVKVEDMPSIYASKREIAILFQNLIENGIKYNESKVPELNIEVKFSDDQLIFSVRDNGIGIDQEYHQKIFQFFKRLHTQEKYQGSGIGLGVCKKIVQNYGGEIRVDSEEEVGTTFQVILPKTMVVEAINKER